MVDLYDCLVKDNGGDITESKLHLVESKEVEPPDEKPVWKYRDAKIASYGDELGGITPGDYERELRIIKHKYHTNSLSDRQIIENYLGGGFPFNDDDRTKDAQGPARREGLRHPGPRRGAGRNPRRHQDQGDRQKPR